MAHEYSVLDVDLTSPGFVGGPAPVVDSWGESYTMAALALAGFVPSDDMSLDWNAEFAPSVSDSVEALIASLEHLDDAETRVVRKIQALIREFADRRGVQVVGVSVSRFSDPDEASEEVVVTQRVALPPDAALDYWDAVGIEVSRLVSTFPPEESRIAIEGLSVNVEW